MIKLSQKMGRLAIIVVVMTFALSAWGNNNCTSGTAGCSRAGGGETQGTEGGGNSAPGGGANINQGARRGSSSQKKAMMINQAAGAVFSAICGAKYGAWACPLAAMSFAQAGHDAAASGQSRGVYDATKYNYQFPSDGELPDGETYDSYKLKNSGGSAGSTTQFSHLDAELKKLAKMGYKLNPEKGTVTTPKGEIPMSAFNSAEGMAKAGYDKASIAAAQATIEKLNADAAAKYGSRANVVSMGTAFRGGGGSRSGGSEAGRFTGSGDDEDSMATYLASLKKKMHRKRDPASMAGMKRMTGGEPIGVAMDNIFEMVHRRYQKKRKENAFIEAPRNSN